MNKPTLYLMLGYPGAGKTTTAKLINEITGAVHLWADKIRRERFVTPTYSHEENLQLYGHLNELAAELLATGQSVIFDTNFSYYKDRKHLSEIAKDHSADSVVIWVTTPKDIAKKRAVDEHHLHTTRILGKMPEQRFEEITANLESPKPKEKVIEIDGTKVTKEYIAQLLANHEAS